MLTKERLEEVIRSMGLHGIEVEVVWDPWGFIVVVAAKDFEGMTEMNREVLVWERLRERIGDEGTGHVQAIFALTPDEYASGLAQGVSWSDRFAPLPDHDEARSQKC